MLCIVKISLIITMIYLKILNNSNDAKHLKYLYDIPQRCIR